jgi:Sec-independent protein secretion pathway component TatC
MMVARTLLNYIIRLWPALLKRISNLIWLMHICAVLLAHCGVLLAHASLLPVVTSSCEDKYDLSLHYNVLSKASIVSTAPDDVSLSIYV